MTGRRHRNGAVVVVGVGGGGGAGCGVVVGDVTAGTDGPVVDVDTGRPGDVTGDGRAERTAVVVVVLVVVVGGCLVTGTAPNPRTCRSNERICPA